MSQRGKIIFVDDEKEIRLARAQTLELAGYEVLAFDSAEKALKHISPEWPGILVSDIKMPGIDGLSFMKEVLQIDPGLPVILITGHGNVPMAVEAIHNGAYDFIEKPCPTETFLETIHRAMEKRFLVLENRTLKNQLDSQKDLHVQIIGESPSLDRVRRIIDSIAQTDADILILGETGTGKELVARCLHHQSARARGQFVAVNCGALPETIIESELFGHEPGAFTGANEVRIGKFEYAHRGTLFLDEIESMPMPLQVKILRTLQERSLERLGSNETRSIDIRVLAATKIDLKEACAQGKFREDLFYRLNVAQIAIPPLRERTGDIPMLFRHFVLQACRKYKYPVPEIPGECVQRLMTEKWPGNIRELKNEAERFVLGQAIGDAAAFNNPEGLLIQRNSESANSLNDQVGAFEKILIEQELFRQKGDIKKTHTALGLPRQTLYDKMGKYQIKRDQYT